MNLWDVNVWVYAFRPDSPLHARARVMLEDSLARREPFLFCPFLAASFLRLVTNPRVFVQPSDIHESWRFLDSLETDPAAQYTEMDRQTYAIFKHLGLVTLAAGNSVPDALIAATALRHDARLFTADKAFHAYPGVDVELIAR